MANRLPSLGNFSISDDVVNTHEWVADFFIDQLGVWCKLVYPEIDSECPNCFLDLDTKRSTNIYNGTGPYPFTNNTICPYCGGVGRLSAPSTENIRLRVYYSPKDWVKLEGLPLVSPDGMAQVIGYMADLPKFERAQYIIINNNVKTMREYRVVRAGEALPWGFRQNRYFVQMVKRGNGG